MMRTHEVYWSKPIGGVNRKGHPCTIITTGKGKQVQVKFEDGTTAILDRRAIRAKSKS